MKKARHYTKEEKAKDINNAIKRSAEAKEVGAKAEIFNDGTIQYSVKTKTRTGRAYRIKVPFSKLLSYLWGEDMRRLKKKYGR